MGLEDLHFLPRDHRAANAANELFALAAEHHAGDNLDPSAARAVEHAGELLGVRGGRSAALHVAANASRPAFAAIVAIARPAIASCPAITAETARPSIPPIPS